MIPAVNTFEEDKRRFRLWLVGIFSVLLLLAAAGWLARTPYRHFKERRSAVQAQSFLAKGDFRNAALSARQTLLLNPTNVPACRVMAALADLAHSPAVLDWQRRIVQAEPSVENKLQLASAGLRYQAFPFPLPAQILEELAPTATNLASYHVVAASLALSQRRLADAENHFQIAAELAPTNRLYEMNLAVIRLGMTNVTKAIPARVVLENFRSDTNFAAPALRALMADRLIHRDPSAALAYSSQLLADAHANLGDRLQQLGILQQLTNGDFAPRLRAIQQQAATNAPAVAEVAVWMQANGLLAQSISWLTNLPAPMPAQSPVRLVLADGLVQSADWLALRDLTSKSDWDEMNFVRLALLSHAWSQLGVPPVAESNWGSAVNEAGSRYSAMVTLLSLAERWQLAREREDLLRRMIEKFPQERWPWQALEQTYLAAGNTAGLNQLYAKSLLHSPQDIGLKNNLAFTSLLLKTNLAQAEVWAAEVYAGRTNDPVVATTYALALHVQGRTQDGLAVLQKLDARFLRQPDAALYYAILLTATGATNEATPFVNIARSKTQWLPEEKQLLDQTAAGL